MFYIFVQQTSPKKSLDSQRFAGEEYAKQNSISLSIVEDTHSSGRTPVNELPGLRWLIDLIEVGLIKNVIVTCFTRISRDVKELIYFQSLLEKHNAKLIVIDKGKIKLNNQ